MNKRKEIVPNNLREYRLKAGMTQKQVARYLNLRKSQNRITKWEMGIAIPHLNNLLKLCKIYKVEVKDMYHIN